MTQHGMRVAGSMIEVRRWLRGAGSRGRAPSRRARTSKSERLVEVYEIQGRLTFGAMAWWDEFGAWGATSAVVSVPADAEDEAVGSALIDMFDASDSLPVETGSEGTEVLLDEAGVRSRSALVRAARYLVVTRQADGSVQLVPSLRDGGRGGWLHQPEAEVVLQQPSTEELGVAVRGAIERST